MFGMSFINRKVLGVAWKVTKTLGGAILIEGLKGVAWNGAANVLVSVASNKGFSGLKKMTLNEFVGKDTPKVVSKVKSAANVGRVIVDGEFEVVKETKSDT
jgi:hypothetical protein